MKNSSREGNSSKVPQKVLCLFWHLLFSDHLSCHHVKRMIKQVAVVAGEVVAAVVMMAAPITVTTFVVVTAGHTASLSTRANYVGGCANLSTSSKKGNALSNMD